MLAVPAIGLGTANFGRQLDLAAATALVSAALEMGVAFIDTAVAYPGSEAMVGEALRGRRAQVILATKIGHPQMAQGGVPGAPANLRREVEESLRRLRTDHIDLCYLHFPDPATPMAETLGAMSEFIAEGKVRFAGASNFDAAEIRAAGQAARDGDMQPFRVYQNRCSLLNRAAERAALLACRGSGAGYIAYAPLARGLLTGRFRRGEAIPRETRLGGSGPVPQAAEFDRVEALAAFAERRGLSLLQLALGGLLADPDVGSLILGASTPAQLRASVAASAWRPSAAEIAGLEAIA